MEVPVGHLLTKSTTTYTPCTRANRGSTTCLLVLGTVRVGWKHSAKAMPHVTHRHRHRHRHRHTYTHIHTHTPVHELQCLTRVQSRDSRLGLPACDQKRWTLRKWCDGIHWWPPHVTSSSRPPSRVGDVDATLPPDAAGQRAQEWFRVGRASRLTITATIARPASIVTLGIGAAGCGPEALVTAIFIFLVTVSWPGVMIRRLFKLAAQHTILQKATQHV